MRTSVAAIIAISTFCCPYEATVDARTIDRDDSASKYGFVVCVQNVTFPLDVPHTLMFIQYREQMRHVS